jgi:hypothetical protein
MPYVSYYVLKDKNTLIRLEAAKKITLPIKYEDRFSIYVDLLITNVSDFNIYTRNMDINTSDINEINIDRSSSVLLYLKSKVLNNLLLELAI